MVRWDGNCNLDQQNYHTLQSFVVFYCIQATDRAVDYLLSPLHMKLSMYWLQRVLPNETHFANARRRKTKVIANLLLFLSGRGRFYQERSLRGANTPAAKKIMKRGPNNCKRIE